MKYLVLAILVLAASAAGADADTDHWTSTLKHPPAGQARSAAIDGDYCNQVAGPNLNGRPTPPAFKRCMASRGWRYQGTTREKTWIDPDTGLTCHDILDGFGSACSNF